MAKNTEFLNSLQNFRNKIKAKIEQFNQLEDELPRRMCEVFVKRARQRLLQNANTDQIDLIMSLLGNIYYRKGRNGYQVIIRQDPEGLMMFLEYGTGLIGEADPHPESGEVGWEYAVNASSNSKAYRSVNGRFGWFFRTDSDETYIEKTDSNRRDGGTLVFSQGIKPVRYIYETKLELEDVLRRSRGNIDLLFKMLEQLEAKSL